MAGLGARTPRRRPEEIESLVGEDGKQDVFPSTEVARVRAMQRVLGSAMRGWAWRAVNARASRRREKALNRMSDALRRRFDLRLLAVALERMLQAARAAGDFLRSTDFDLATPATLAAAAQWQPS